MVAIYVLLLVCACVVAVGLVSTALTFGANVPIVVLVAVIRPSAAVIFVFSADSLVVIVEFNADSLEDIRLFIAVSFAVILADMEDSLAVIFVLSAASDEVSLVSTDLMAVSNPAISAPTSSRKYSIGCKYVSIISVGY